MFIETTWNSSITTYIRVGKTGSLGSWSRVIVYCKSVGMLGYQLFLIPKWITGSILTLLQYTMTAPRPQNSCFAHPNLHRIKTWTPKMFRIQGPFRTVHCLISNSWSWVCNLCRLFYPSFFTYNVCRKGMQEYFSPNDDKLPQDDENESQRDSNSPTPDQTNQTNESQRVQGPPIES